MPRTVRKPSYLLHKPTGQARVRIRGKDFYLGPYGSPESREKYDDLMSEWFDGKGDVTRYSMTVDDLVLRYLAFCQTYYVKDGTPTGETTNIRIPLRHVVKVARNTRARDFGPKLLKAVRQSMVDAKLMRTSINIHVCRIRRMFKWAAAEELLPVTVFQSLATVSGLQRGRTTAPERTPVKPVAEALVEAVKPFVSRPVWGAIRLQLLTGMRSGEVLRMRTCDINTSGNIWEYTPSSHKGDHHGRGRTVYLGPQAQDVVREFLRTSTTEYLFDPREGRAEFVAANYRQDAKRTGTGKHTPGKRYTPNSYADAITKACERAQIDPWHPHQLRHSAGTRLRREFGIETARVALGHTSAMTTEIYAEVDRQKAKDAAARIG